MKEENKNLETENLELIELDSIDDFDDEYEGSGKGLKIAAGIGLAALVAGLGYKFIVKPARAKIKAKKESKEEEVNEVVEESYEEFEGDIFEEESEVVVEEQKTKKK